MLFDFLRRMAGSSSNNNNKNNISAARPAAGIVPEYIPPVAGASSIITNYSQHGYNNTANYNYGTINASIARPAVPFSYSYELYDTIGKVQNTVESYINELLSRDWYFDGSSAGVKAMETFEEDFNFSRLLEYIIRDWLVTGNSIIGITDWQPVQITAVTGLARDRYGSTTDYFITIDGKEQSLLKSVNLTVDDYIHTKYIEKNRDAFGIGMFYSLTTAFLYPNAPNKTSLPILELYRQHLQNLAKIEEKYASPRVAWVFENMSQEIIDSTINPLLRAWKPGERLALGKTPQLLTETIDARGQLINSIAPVIDGEVEAGLQSSANRLITQPSAMADAREANTKDDARLLGIMEKIRRLVNALIIPKITQSKCEFKWGSQDSFDTEMPPGLDIAIKLGVVGKLEARAILTSMGWKLDDALYNKEQQEKQQQMQQMQMQQQQQQQQTKEKPKPGQQPQTDETE